MLDADYWLKKAGYRLTLGAAIAIQELRFGEKNEKWWAA